MSLCHEIKWTGSDYHSIVLVWYGKFPKRIWTNTPKEREQKLEPVRLTDVND